MKINYTPKEVAQICKGEIVQIGNNEIIHTLSYDSRKIHDGHNSLFLCLKTPQQNGHHFITDAYQKGTRIFLIDEKIEFITFPEATCIQVDDVLNALQTWAAHHRMQFTIPVIGITGSAGKTTVKEWLFHLLSDSYKINRSPKSFNSQLGVALSLFEINATTEIAILEAGISQQGEMKKLMEMIQPTIGVFTAFNRAHRDGFANEKEHFSEKFQLFLSCDVIFAPEAYASLFTTSSKIILSKSDPNFNQQNRNLIEAIGQYFQLTKAELSDKLDALPRIALRMENFEGINGNTLLYDAFNWNLDGLEQGLAYQSSISGQKNRYLVFEKEAFDRVDEKEIIELVNRFSLNFRSEIGASSLIFGTSEINDLLNIQDSNILFKGAQLALKRQASALKARKHSTFVEINLPALKHNLQFWQKRTPDGCQLLAMVKASSYGAELTKISSFLEQQGISYLGVAFADEGVELRKNGVKMPIMVMNSDASSWPDCIRFQLEPSVFSMEQLEALVTELIHQEIDQFPIHLKLDTGMHRLGFQSEDFNQLLSFLQAQPEVMVKSIFSHLAEADNLNDTSFTLQQISIFERISEKLQSVLPYPFMKHILNSEGVSNFPDYSFDMVRLGIGMFGVSSNPNVEKQLLPILSWNSTVSQVKKISTGDSVGYGRRFIASKDITIAVIPVGYADGFRRNLSEGKGGVFIQNVFYPTIGRICMDMLMIDCGNSSISAGDEVEIIGNNQTIQAFARKAETIPYEILTGLSPRIPRIFIEEVD